MNKQTWFAIEILKFMNQEIVIRNTDYYTVRLPYFSKPRLLSLVCLRFSAECDL